MLCRLASSVTTDLRHNPLYYTTSPKNTAHFPPKFVAVFSEDGAHRFAVPLGVVPQPANPQVLTTQIAQALGRDTAEFVIEREMESDPSQ
jgi:hypothetical protein